MIETFFIFNDSQYHCTTEQKQEFIGKINHVFIAMIFTMVHMTILQHKSGKYEKNYYARDGTIESKSLHQIIRPIANIELQVYKAHLALFDSFYSASARRERYFAMHRAYLLARLELREGVEDSVKGVVL